MVKEIINGSEKGVSRKIIPAASLEEFANVVNEGGGKIITVGGRVDVVEGFIKYSLLCDWQKENDVNALFREFYTSGRGKKTTLSNRLKLLATIENRLDKLRELLHDDVKILGPAERMPPEDYERMLYELKGSGIKPFPINAGLDSKSAQEEKTDRGTNHSPRVRENVFGSPFSLFEELVEENKIKKIMVEPYKYLINGEEGNNSVVYGTQIVSELDDGTKVKFCNRNLEPIPVDELDSHKKNLYSLQSFVTSCYYAKEIREGLDIPAKGPKMDSITREEMVKGKEKNNMEPFDFPELTEFLKKKRSISLSFLNPVQEKVS